MKLEQMQTSKQIKAIIIEKAVPAFNRGEKSGTKGKSILETMVLKSVNNTLKQ
jgi:hypothetical protein